MTVAAGLAIAGCASPPPQTPTSDAATLRDARTALAKAQSRLTPSATRGLRITASIAEARTGRTLSARGAIAVRPPDGVRMQLVGPAGATALDVWIAGDRDRLAVPALDRVERGPASEARPGRPVAFLRWWMLRPLEGTLLAAFRTERGTKVILRAADGARIEADLDDDERTVRASRRTALDDETVLSVGGPCGDETYESRASGVRVEIHCEGDAPEPSPRAFADPDEPR
jgi:hypothetical protein